MSKLSDQHPPYRSDEEVYFAWWLEEVRQAGYIEEYRYEQREFRLFDGLTGSYTEQLKTRSREKTFKILGKRVYTPDFEIRWSPAAEGIFYNELDCGLPAAQRAYFVAQGGVSLVEVKPGFDSNNMTRHVKALIDWTWQRHGELVQLSIVLPKVSKSGKCSPSSTLYTDTCIPGRFLRTDADTRMRTIRFGYRLLEEYVEERRALWEEIKRRAA